MEGRLKIKLVQKSRYSSVSCSTDSIYDANFFVYRKLKLIINPFVMSYKAYSAVSGSINILYVTGLAARAIVKSELKAA